GHRVLGDLRRLAMRRHAFTSQGWKRGSSRLGHGWRTGSDGAGGRPYYRGSRTCTTIGPAAVSWAWSAAGAAPVPVAVAARAGAAAPMAVTASPAAPAVAAPCSRERRDMAARFASSLGMTILSVTGLRAAS